MRKKEIISFGISKRWCITKTYETERKMEEKKNIYTYISLFECSARAGGIGRVYIRVGSLHTFYTKAHAYIHKRISFPLLKVRGYKFRDMYL